MPYFPYIRIKTADTTNMKRFVILTLCIITGTCINAQEKFKTTRQIQASSAKINGIYIPRDVNDAVNVLDTLLTNEQKDTLKTLSYEDYMAGLHHGLGMKLRNDWVYGRIQDSVYTLHHPGSPILTRCPIIFFSLSIIISTGQNAPILKTSSHHPM